ncbi:MAG: hypothetical protein H7A32_01310 [Deltaproteobacteria bacterium]|nr:hypothetical protein [Deltaproteobacteria bacterium]
MKYIYKITISLMVLFFSSSAFAAATKPNVQLWPGGKVYYEFSDSITNENRLTFKEVVKWWSFFGKIEFIERNNEENYVEIRSTGGKSASNAIGMAGGKQWINLGDWLSSTILHETGHVLGLIHEHTRTDRDKYVEILKENIKIGDEDIFDYAPTQIITNYDFNSIMHYHAYASSKNGLPTIRRIKGPNFTDLGGIHLSHGDKVAINRLYPKKQAHGYQEGIGLYNPSTGEVTLDNNRDGRYAQLQEELKKFDIFDQKALSGDWNGDGIDELAFYTPFPLDGYYQISMDKNGDGIITESEVNKEIIKVYKSNALIFISGDWNGDGVDELGYYDYQNKQFLLDNGNNILNEGEDSIIPMNFSTKWRPISGDWNGDGVDELAFYNIDNAEVCMDQNGDDVINQSECFIFIDIVEENGGLEYGDAFVAGDFDGDGKDTLALYTSINLYSIIKNPKFYINSHANVTWSESIGKRYTNYENNVLGVPLAGKWAKGLSYRENQN